MGKTVGKWPFFFWFGVQIDIGTKALLLTLEHPQADLGQLIKRMIIHDLAAGL